MKPLDVIFMIAIGLLIGLAFGSKAGEIAGEKRECARMMDEAVKHGHGRYFLDANNERKWEWLPACNAAKSN